MTGWAGLLARLDRVKRQRRIARFLLRLFRLNEIEALPVGEYAVAFGYVTLATDQAEVVRAARKVVQTAQSAPRRARSRTPAQWAALDLLAAIERFDEMYPEAER